MRIPLPTILLALLGLAGGIAARRLSQGGFPLTAALSLNDAPGSLPGKSNAAGVPTTTAVTGEAASLSPGHPGRRLSPGEILDLRGMERNVRFGEWLVTATTSELREFIVALPHARVTGSTLADAIFLRWAELDVEEAVAYGTSQGYAAMAWWSWAKLDPEAALAAAAARKAPDGAQALRAVAQMDPERGRRLMEQYPQFIERTSLEGLSYGLFKSDPRAAAEMSLRTRGSESDGIVKSWAFKDPAAAIAWATQIKSPAQRNRAMSLVIAQLETSSPEQAGSAIQAMPPGITRNSLMAKHAAQLALSDPASGIEYARRLDVPGLRQQALAAISKTLAADRPTEALALMKDVDWKKITPSASTSLSNAMGLLGRTAPEEALKFASGLPDRDGPSFRSLVFQSWSDADVCKASGWLAAQPPEQREGVFVSTLISHLLEDGPDQDPEAAVRWSLSAFPGDGHMLTEAFQAWHRRDPAAARQALDLPGVPESVRAALAAPTP